MPTSSTYTQTHIETRIPYTYICEGENVAGRTFLTPTLPFKKEGKDFPQILINILLMSLARTPLQIRF